jgi:peroxiredoxin Q/BCP
MTHAPEFSLTDQSGIVHTLTSYAGKWVLLYFYPKDDTPGCTKEACGFRDASTAYRDAGIVVLGVSKDSVESHKKFADKYNLSFPLLSDPTLATIKAYGAWGEKKFMGRVFQGIKRISFLIGPDQKIKKEYQNVNVLVHATEILHDKATYSA